MKGGVESVRVPCAINTVGRLRSLCVVLDVAFIHLSTSIHTGARTAVDTALRAMMHSEQTCMLEHFRSMYKAVFRLAIHIHEARNVQQYI